jgi:four helix bundle protein
MNKHDMEERMVEFASHVIQVASELPRTIAGKILCTQMSRSGTSVALNYAEALSGESRRDFIHKIRLSLKELRETYMILRIVIRSGIYKNQETISSLLTETNILIAILVKTINTATKNQSI